MHTLLEQDYAVTNAADSMYNFLTDKIGLTENSAANRIVSMYLNGENGILFKTYNNQGTSAGADTILSFITKSNSEQNKVFGGANGVGTVFYHISEGESVKYFKFRSLSENSYTYVIAQDVNGEWVVFNGDKMYTNYGETGIYNNFYNGSHAEIVDGNNTFMISNACRFDTGAKFKELCFVSSAKSYSDTNCIVIFGGKNYRLVSVSNVKDETGRYPAFAFPVSD